MPKQTYEHDDYEYEYIEEPVEEVRPKPNYAAKRGGCLTAWLLCVGLVAIASLFFSLLSLRLIENGLLAIISSLIMLVGVIALWRVQKWGYYLLLGIYALNIVALPFLFMMAKADVFFVLGTVVPSIVGFAVLYILVNNRRRLFR